MLPKPRSRSGNRKDQQQVGDRRVGDEDFAAVENVAIAFLLRPAAHAEGVRAGVRFGHGVAADRLAAHQGRQIFFFLRGVAETEDRLDAGPQVRVEGKDQSMVPAAVAETFQCQHAGEGVEPEAAVFFGNRQPEQTEIGAPAPAVAKKLPPFFPGGQIVRQLVPGETNHRLPQFGLLRRQRKIHGFASSGEYVPPQRHGDTEETHIPLSLCLRLGQDFNTSAAVFAPPSRPGRELSPRRPDARRRNGDPGRGKSRRNRGRRYRFRRDGTGR